MDFIIEDKNLARARYSSPFGNRIHPVTGKASGHRGIDIATPQRTPLIAPLNGVVHMNRTNGGGVNSGYGHYLVLKLENGDYVLYGHLVERSKLQVGAKVTRGQVVALSGNTGASTGAHVHFEYHVNGFLFASQVKNFDTVIDPVLKYPQLSGMLGKYLGDLVVKPEPVKASFLNYSTSPINIQEKKLIVLRGVRKNFTDTSYNQFIALKDLEALGFDISFVNRKTIVSKGSNYRAPVTNMDYIVSGMKDSKVEFNYQGKDLSFEGLENIDRLGNPTRFIPIVALNQLGYKVEWSQETQTIILK